MGSVDDEHLAVILDFFGSVTLSMLTLLQATTGGGDWRDVHGALSEAGNVVALCFVVYVLFFVIAVWNIITATFVEKMSKMCKPDNDALAMEERMRNFEVAVDLKEILQKMRQSCEEKLQVTRTLGASIVSGDLGYS